METVVNMQVRGYLLQIKQFNLQQATDLASVQTIARRIISYYHCFTDL